MSIVKLKDKYQITIPEDVRKKLPCEIGGYIDVRVEGSHIVIYPVILEECYPEKELKKMKALFKNPDNRGKIMGSLEFEKHLEKL